MTLLALDQCTTTTGYCVLTHEGVLLDYGTITTKGTDTTNRIIEQKQAIIQLLTTHGITHVALEQPILKFNIVSSVLFQLLGVITATLRELKIPYEVLNVTHWKSIVGIKSKTRNKQKLEGLQIVNKKYSLTLTENDISDAILIGIAYLKEEESRL